MVGGDCVDLLPGPDPDLPLPLHQVGIGARGLTLLDWPHLDRVVAMCAQLGRRAVLTYDFLLMTVILGGIVFYLFWEVKSAYAISFLPFFFLLAGGHTLPMPEKKHRKTAVRIGLCAVWAAVLIGAGNVQRVAALRSQTPKYVIRS